MIIPNGISVVVCCFNSEKRIGETLKHLFVQQNLSRINWEIIVVNNGSNDLTKHVISSIENEYNPGISFQVVDEDKTGLSYARQKGIIKSKYPFVLFCDDDNWLNTNYVVNFYHFLSNNDDYGVVGGNGIPKCEIIPPEWFKSYKGIYATGCRNDGDVTNVYGAGMGLKKSLLLDFTSNLSDRKGISLTSGGDSEICLFMRKKGYKIRQLCSNTFVHFIPEERLKLSYLFRMARGRGETKAQLKLLNDENKKMGLAYRLKRDIYDLIKVLIKMNKIDLTFFYYHKLGFWTYILKDRD